MPKNFVFSSSVSEAPAGVGFVFGFEVNRQL